jgi:hypothetical protein
VVKAAELRPICEAGAILDRLESLIGDARRIGADALAAGKHGPAIQALRAVTANLELIARLTGQLDNNGNTQINIALVQQQQAEVLDADRLRKLTVDERNTLRMLLAKMNDNDVIDAEAVQVTGTQEGDGR